jgi:hypothetical protein
MMGLFDSYTFTVCSQEKTQNNCLDNYSELLFGLAS